MNIAHVITPRSLNALNIFMTQNKTLKIFVSCSLPTIISILEVVIFSEGKMERGEERCV